MAEYILNINSDSLNVDILNNRIERFMGNKLGPRIVRCRDCVYCGRLEKIDGGVKVLWCQHHIAGTNLDGFCAWGERR